MKHKERILELRAEGKSYNEIAKILNCSKGTVCYHCGDNQKERVKANTKRYKEKDVTLFHVKRKIEKFNIKIKSNDLYKPKLLYNCTKRIRYKCLDFCGVYQIKMLDVKPQYIIDKLKANPSCELTGRPIDIENTYSWHLDHITPPGKGGTNTLDNCQIVCKEANQAKSDLLTEEFLQLCVDVLKHHNYQVISPTN